MELKEHRVQSVGHLPGIKINQIDSRPSLERKIVHVTINEGEQPGLPQLIVVDEKG